MKEPPVKPGPKIFLKLVCLKIGFSAISNYYVIHTFAMTNYLFVKLHSKRLIQKYNSITIPVIKMYNEIVILFLLQIAINFIVRGGIK